MSQRFDDVISEGVLGLRRMGKTTYLRSRVANEPRAVVWDPFNQIPMAATFYSGREAADYIRKNPAPRILRVRVVSTDPGDFEDLIEGVVQSGGRLFLVLDEVSILCNPITGRPNARLAWIIDYGRNLGIAVLWSARRVAQVGQLVAGQSERIYCFRIVGDADLDAVRGRMGRSRTEQLRTLPQFRYLRSLE